MLHTVDRVSAAIFLSIPPPNFPAPRTSGPVLSLGAMQISVVTASEMEYTLHVEGSDIIGEVREQIQSKEGRLEVYINFPNHMVATRKIDMSDSFDVAKAKVQEQFNIAPEKQQVCFDAFMGSFGVTFFVVTLSGNRMTIDASWSQTLDSVKAQIRDSWGIAPKQQRLLLEGEELKNDMQLHNYKVRTGNTLTLVVEALESHVV